MLGAAQEPQTQILAVSVDSHEDSNRLVREIGGRFPGALDFPLLEDREHRVIARYGILNPDGQGWPHPATYVIDKGGVVRWRFVAVDYTRRPTNAAIIEALRELP